MEKLSLFLGLLLCFIQIIKPGFCTEAQEYGFEATSKFANVLSFGAVGDGKTDDSQAFLRAWEAVCKGGSGQSTLLVPHWKTFMLKPLTFGGPCKTPVSVVIKGHLVAPPYTWDVRRYGSWIGFDNVAGLIVTGGGLIDGQGSYWWGKVQDRPSALHFHKCDGLRLSQLRHLNSPRNHIGINDSKNVNVWKLSITAPEDSPNTDGIDISSSRGVNIHDSTIATGDDCIAINTGSSFINISRIFCGPGHGISVGSLGAHGSYAAVEEVTVKNCTLTNTTNGVRIKTFQGGSGYARKISFKDIHVEASQNPIIVDQFYASNGNKGGKGGVRVSGVRYDNVHGTSANEEAIQLICNSNLGCTDIVMNSVVMKPAVPGNKIYSVCNNAHGIFSSVQPLACLST